MSEASDLECLDAAAWSVRRSGYGQAILYGGSKVRRGVALIDAALVRGLREWRDLGNGLLLLEHGRITARALPKLGREARRRLGR